MRAMIDGRQYEIFCPDCGTNDVSLTACTLSAENYVSCAECGYGNILHREDKGMIGAGRVNAELVDEEAEEEESLIDELKRRIERLEEQVDILCDEIGME